MSKSSSPCKDISHWILDLTFQIKNNFFFFCHTMWLQWRRQWHPTPVLLPGKSHGQRSLVGYSPWGRQELDSTGRLHFHFSVSCIGEGNGNPLQGSCLENPRNGGAWWEAVYGVAQSWTRLKWLSSSYQWLQWIFVPWPGIEPGTLQWKAMSPNHWTTRKFPWISF